MGELEVTGQRLKPQPLPPSRGADAPAGAAAGVGPTTSSSGIIRPKASLAGGTAGGQRAGGSQGAGFLPVTPGTLKAKANILQIPIPTFDDWDGVETGPEESPEPMDEAENPTPNGHSNASFPTLQGAGMGPAGRQSIADAIQSLLSPPVAPTTCQVRRLVAGSITQRASLGHVASTVDIPKAVAAVTAASLLLAGYACNSTLSVAAPACSHHPLAYRATHIHHPTAQPPQAKRETYGPAWMTPAPRSASRLQAGASPSDRGAAAAAAGAGGVRSPRGVPEPDGDAHTINAARQAIMGMEEELGTLHPQVRPAGGCHCRGFGAVECTVPVPSSAGCMRHHRMLAFASRELQLSRHP